MITGGVSAEQAAPNYMHMKKTTRRKFIAAAALTATGAVVGTDAFAAEAGAEAYPIIHHVFFWLKNPGSKGDKEKLIAGIKTLAKIGGVHNLKVGIQAATETRDVTDKTWHVSELIFFKDVAAQAAYQKDPIHLEFVKNCSSLWEKVVVNDMQVV